MTIVYADTMDASKVERLLNLLCAFPIVLQEHIQGFLSPKLLKDYLSESDQQRIDRVTNRPFFILNKLAKEVRTIPDSVNFTSRERLGKYDACFCFYTYLYLL
jgi:predicted membrane chloride channel (bestrophin family)